MVIDPANASSGILDISWLGETVVDEPGNVSNTLQQTLIMIVS
jgi:hypothetical protein